MAAPKADNNAGHGLPEAIKSPKKPRMNKYALGCAILASMTSIILGYDIGVMSGAVVFIKEDLRINDTQIEILAGILNVYSLVGSAAAGKTSDLIGRRYTIVIAAIIFFAGALLMGFATSYAFLMVARFVAGVGVGYAMMIAPVYTAEVSPASCRGLLISFTEVFINLGILLGYVSNVVFARFSLNVGWRLMLGAGAVPSVFLGIGVLAMPESPRWLVLQGRLGDAKKVLDQTSDSKEEAELRLAEIKEAALIPAECNDAIVQVPKQSRGEGVWGDLLLHPTPAVRRVLLACIGLNFFQQVSGIDGVVLFGPRIFEKAGFTGKNSNLEMTVIVGTVKTLSILIATFFLDKYGRRPLVLTSVGGMVVSLTLLGLGLTVIDTHKDEKVLWAIVLSSATVMTNVAFFSMGLGPIVWVYCSEIFPLRVRAQGFSIGVAVNRVTSGLISMTFISLYKAITIGGSFFFYAGTCAVAFVFCYTFLPETQGRTLEEMEALFENFSWREFHKKGSNRGRQGTSNGDVQLGTNEGRLVT